MNEITRRQWLKLATFAVGGALIKTQIEWADYFQRHPYDEIFKIRFDENNEHLSFDETAQFAKRLDAVFDKLSVPEFAHTKEELIQLALEIIPQYEYEGIVDTARFPEVVDFMYFPDGDSANHVLGRSNCETIAVINARLALPMSVWGKDEELFTLIHELAHVQQGPSICRNTETALVENSAQVGAMEVACGLANQGNPIFLWAALSELRGMAITSAYGLALANNQFDEYRQLRSELSPGAISEARFAKSRRRWTSDPNQLVEIIDRYNITPLNMIFNAIRFNECKITELAFPKVYTNGGNPTRISLEAAPVLLDDTAYLIAHVEEMVEDSLKNGKIKTGN